MKNIIFAKTDFMIINQKQCDHLLELAKQSPNRRSRICLHQSHEDRIQEMMICVLSGTVIPKHKQTFQSSKSYIIISGEMDVGFYDDDGHLTEIIEMGDLNSGKTFSLRFSCQKWTQIKTNTDVVYSEFILGPYSENDTLWKR